MKTMMSLLGTAALVLGCSKQPAEPVVSPPEPDVDIFVTHTPPTKIEPLSPQDAAWKPCAEVQSTASPNFITQYLYQLGTFRVWVDFILHYPSLEEWHGHSYSNSPPPMEEADWLARAFDPKSLRFDMGPDRGDPTLLIVKQSNLNNSKQTLFEKIAAQNNDTAYNGTRWDKHGIYSYIPAERLDIECFEGGAYDAEHPQGASLNDIATVSFYSAQPFITGGYQNLRLGDQCHAAEQTLTLVEFNAVQINLIEGLRLSVTLTEKPERAGVYRFKLTYTDASGASYSATTIPVRLAGQS